MVTTDIIAAVATGWAPGPRAMVRLSGPGVPELLAACTDTRSEHPQPIAASSFLLTADAPGRPALRLPCLVIRYDAPRSFTGQDAAEILFPGNPILLERVMARLTTFPTVREAGPGEFSARAFLLGKLTLSQAEGVAALIAARSNADLAAAESLMSGQTGSEYQSWADELTTLLALVEAGIDFSDQEGVVAIPPADLARRLAGLAGRIRDRLGTVLGREQSPALPTVVLAGPPNAGKSTLFNALLRRRRSVESPVAGTTRDVLAERLDLSGEVPGGPTVLLMDLPGLDYAAGGPIDAAAQQRAREALARADVVIHCDPAGRFTNAPGADPSRPTIRVRTKADLVRAGGPSAEPGAVVEVCALDGWNVAALRRAIADATWARPGEDDSGGLLPRHRRALVQTVDRLDSARAAMHPELIAGDLRAALDCLGELTGRVWPDDVIGRIFATFCVGK